MKVKCINNDGYGGALTLGKTYDANYIDKYKCYELIDNFNIKDLYSPLRFKPLSEIRIEKIDKLINY